MTQILLNENENIRHKERDVSAYLCVCEYMSTHSLKHMSYWKGSFFHNLDEHLQKDNIAYTNGVKLLAK